MLADRKEVKSRRAILPDRTMLIAWVKKEVKPGKPVFERYVKETNHPTIKRALAWSNEVNKSISEMIYSIPPIPWVRESLGTLNKYSDMTVVSQTLGELLNLEWTELNVEAHGINIDDR